MKETRFSELEAAPPVELFVMTQGYASDQFEKKVNLGVGAYRDENDKPWVLPVVKRAKITLAKNIYKHVETEVFGYPPFLRASAELILGKNSIILSEHRLFKIQSLSGTGALTLGANFLFKIMNYSTVYFSKPTWANHYEIFSKAGFSDIRDYRYLSVNKKCLDFDSLLQDLNEAPKNSVIVLHACAHNPTGFDPTEEQWNEIADVMQERNLFPFFDIAYAGFASGDPEKDCFSVRHFAEKGFEIFIAVSFAKTFGLYNERIGVFMAVVDNPSVIPRMKNQMLSIAWGIYSNPPIYGALIVAMILNNPTLKEEWTDCIKIMNNRIKSMRFALYNALKKLKTPGKWKYITEQLGMFSCIGLNSIQCAHIIESHHVWITKSGRVNICGINKKNVDYVAKAIHDTILLLPE